MVIYGADGLTEREQARSLLELAAKEHWELTPLPALEHLPGGKPCFAGQRGREFNLSHNGPLALCALDDHPVGVDIQIVKEWRPGLPGRVCSPEELEWLDGQEDRWSGFTRLWVLKESRVKQSGAGIIGPIRTIRSIHIPLPGELGELLELDGLWFRTYGGRDWMGAACGLSPPPEEICWRELEA